MAARHRKTAAADGKSSGADRAGPGSARAAERGAVDRVTDGAHLRLHGLSPQPARTRGSACSTFTASSCCSTTASATASASSASSSSSTRFVEGLEESGELELEQAYLDFRVNRAFNLRAGMLLAPVGIINERHEPPSFHGVERPFVDTFIIPTTWFDAGAGIHGTFGAAWHYRAYLMAPLDATRITAEEGLAEARQKGFLSNVRSIAQTARLEYGGLPGLTLGTSFWRGETRLQLPPGGLPRGRRRIRRPVPHGSVRDPRRVRAGLHRRRRRAERSAAADHRREPEHRAADARLLRRAVGAAAAEAAVRHRARSCATRTSTRSSACRLVCCR